ncbi:uncharacterized protein V1518DRAFT_377810 [Limtongia smithiae]|uniref:uncharacterized protein n=1 Tax=Limtongia smithiae TaxID=1125753 RepID=UPI0034CEC69B
MAPPAVVSADELPAELFVGKDAERVTMDDADFKLFSWAELLDIIAEAKLELLTRVPSELRRYLMWKKGAVARYGSVPNYVLEERLHWGPDPALLVPVGRGLLQDRRDYKILFNDFPYGFEDGVVHIVVWSKFRIHTIEPPTSSREKPRVEAADAAVIEDFVESTFRAPLGMAKGDVAWFKNWAVLMSIREIDHFHVLLRSPPVDGLTRGEGWTVLERIMGADDVEVRRKWGSMDARVALLGKS